MILQDVSEVMTPFMRMLYQTLCPDSGKHEKMAALNWSDKHRQVSLV